MKTLSSSASHAKASIVPLEVNCSTSTEALSKSLLTPFGTRYRNATALTLLCTKLQAERKGQLRQRAKAICVPAEDNDRVLPNAFSHVQDIRHVQVEAGIHTIGEAAWQSCQRLQIVKLPGTVVCLQDGAFQRCYELRTVLVPGCKQFGRSVFAQCCSLSQIGAAEDTANLLATQAQVSSHAFEGCLALRQVSFERTEFNPSNCARYIPQGGFLGAGINQLDLPADFNFLGPSACENCRRLQRVDLSRTELTAIWGSTFAHCSYLEQLWFPKRLRRIGQEAFLLCSSLREVHTPPALLAVYCTPSFLGMHAAQTAQQNGRQSHMERTICRIQYFRKMPQI